MDSDLFDEWSELEVHMGYVDNLVLMLKGVVTGISTSFPQGGVPTLTVQGSSLYRRLLDETRRKPFKASTDGDLAREVAKDLGLDAEVDDTQAEIPLVSPNGETYAKFIKQRANRIGYELTVKESTLYFQKPRYIDNPSPILKLSWGRNLISFSPNLSTYDNVTQVTVRGVQTSQGGGKEPIVGVANAGSEREIMGEKSASQIAQSSKKGKEITLDDHNIASQQEAKDMALGQLEMKSLEFITGKGSAVGNPLLRARNVIELEGIGKRFSGKYYVTSATHTIDSGGYKTDFEIKRNGR